MPRAAFEVYTRIIHFVCL